MPRAITYNCDICGAQRKEANHWFVAFNAIKEISFGTWAQADCDGLLHDEGAIYLCGQACAHKQLDQFLQSTSESE